MLTLLKVMCRNNFKKRITLPTAWFKQTEESIVLSYFIDEKMRFITIERSEDGAEFLQENGIIDSYEGSGRNLKLIEKKLFTIAGKNQEPVQLYRITELQWNKIKFFPSDVIHFASLREYEIQGFTLGLLQPKPKAKLRNMQAGVYDYKAA